MKYRVVIQQDEDGVFVAEVPTLPGCISQGYTREDAIVNVKEAVVAYTESLKKHDEPIPLPMFLRLWKLFLLTMKQACGTLHSNRV